MMSVISPKFKQDGGFTFTEVLAAVLLLSIGLLAILYAIGAARDARGISQNIAVGSNIAQSKLAETRANIDNFDNTTVTSSVSSLPPGNQVVITTSRYPDSSEMKLSRVIVTVTWPERKGTRRICYESLVAKH